MKNTDIQLGSTFGNAAMAFVANYTGHPKMCMFFITVGVIGAIISLIGGLVAGIITGITK